MPRKKRSAGLGDTVEKVTKATGIKTVVEAVSKATGLDCGCQERKEWLNKTFSYVNKEKKCMNEEQILSYEIFKENYIDVKKTSVLVPHDEIKRLIDLYNSIFQVNVRGCESCNLKTYVDRIEGVYQSVINTK